MSADDLNRHRNCGRSRCRFFFLKLSNRQVCIVKEKRQ